MEAGMIVAVVGALPSTVDLSLYHKPQCRDIAAREIGGFIYPISCKVREDFARAGQELQQGAVLVFPLDDDKQMARYHVRRVDNGGLTYDPCI